jgi:hypothetical protein
MHFNSSTRWFSVVSAVLCNVLAPPRVKCPFLDSSSRLTEQVQIKVKIVQSDEAQAEDFLSFNEVPEVTAGKGATRGAGATSLDWFTDPW